MPVSGAGPRVVLRRLREVMAQPGTPQSQLDQIVSLIAANMVAEVCSIYLLRAGEILELFASEGLNPQAVHQTRLRIGEGLVGEIAARGSPLNLADAQSHPSFVYRPETGEEIYHSLLGVPILRGGQVIGVLLIQNKTYRNYTEEEVEALQTVAMVMAELVTSARFIDPEELREGSFHRGLPPQFEGLPMSEGIAIGKVVLHEPRIEVARLIADDPESEKQRMASALRELVASIDRLLISDEGMAGEHREVIEAYRMFAVDRGWRQKLDDAIDTGLTAEAAVQRVQVDNRRRMMKIADPYLRERLADLDDLSNRLIRHLSGDAKPSAMDMPENTIVVASNMGPAELLDYERSRLKGVILSDGAPNSHVVIVAKALGIPLVGRVNAFAAAVEAGDDVILDGDEGLIFLRPAADVLNSYQENIASREARVAQFAALRDKPAITRDGVRIELNMNAGLTVDLPRLDETGADGIGLFRTEFQFMVSSTLPRIETQIDLYKRVLAATGERKAIFRTLDIGGDKVVPFMKHEGEENPAMGWRAIRIGLDRPALLRYQARALLLAGEGHDLYIMLPMIANVAEFKSARATIMKEVQHLDRHGRLKTRSIKIGCMLEVPALAFQLKAILPLLDFVSIGSNDLMQFLFACDRGNPRLANRYDIISPAALSFLKMVVTECNAHNVPFGLCGEAAGRPIEAMALIGIGFRAISMPASSIGPVKAMVRSLDCAALTDYMETLLNQPDHSLRGKLRNFALDHGILI